MKKLFIATLILGLATLGRATVTIDLTFGLLTDPTGSTPIADGQLIQLIASPDNVFDAPTPVAFIGGNDVIVFSGNFDSSSTGIMGSMNLSLSGLSSSIASNNLLVRWFPTLAGGAAAPGYSTSYGQYGSLTDVAWVAPADGGTLTNSSFLTLSAGGLVANSAGYASLTTTAIPEPSTYAAIFGALALGFVAYRRRQQAA